MTYENLNSFKCNTYKKTGGRAPIMVNWRPSYWPVANSLTIKYIATNPASNTPLSSETEIRCNRLNSASNGLSATVA